MASPRKIVFLFIGIIFITAVFIINYWVMSQIDSLKTTPHQVPTPPVLVQESKAPVVTGEVKRRMIYDPSREFAINTIAINDQEVAHFRSIDDKILELEGNIPDGKVSFIDESNGTYGEEYFQGNVRHGPYREYYQNATIKQEMEYRFGKIMSVKEYFFDGHLRMEADYSDAILFTNDKEVGKGKIYYRSGVLMYEWNLTNLDKNRFKKSYNVKGQLVEIKTYDSQGQLIEKVAFPAT